MVRRTLATSIRGVVVAGIIGGASIVGLATAQAAPDAGSTAAVTAAADCQTYWPTPYKVCGEIRDLYNSLGGPSSALSFPSGPEVTNPDGSKYSTFLNGTIQWSASAGAYVG
ncbi:MAG: LGFP repeat-containing protein [Rhodococcus sp. (in: high G+C Gram-positive bacteria)]